MKKKLLLEALKIQSQKYHETIEFYIDEIIKESKIEGFEAATEQHVESGGACVTSKYESIEDYKYHLENLPKQNQIV